MAAGNGHAGEPEGKAPGGDGPGAAAKRLRLILGDAEATETFLSKRHVLDVLADFPAARLTTSQVRMGGRAAEEAAAAAAALSRRA